MLCKIHYSPCSFFLVSVAKCHAVCLDKVEAHDIALNGNVAFTTTSSVHFDLFNCYVYTHLVRHSYIYIMFSINILYFIIHAERSFMSLLSKTLYSCLEVKLVHIERLCLVVTCYFSPPPLPNPPALMAVHRSGWYFRRGLFPFLASNCIQSFVVSTICVG